MSKMSDTVRILLGPGPKGPGPNVSTTMNFLYCMYLVLP